jgi:hypothetical protein
VYNFDNILTPGVPKIRAEGHGRLSIISYGYRRQDREQVISDESTITLLHILRRANSMIIFYINAKLEIIG